MAIMVGGGLTFAIPGMEPAHAAQINSEPNLRVSAEGQNADNEIATTNVVEVIVRDGDIDANDDSPPIVEVDDTRLTMTFFSGSWYAYFASEKIVDTGLIAKTVANATASVTQEQADDANEVAVNALVRGSPFEYLTADETDRRALITGAAIFGEKTPINVQLLPIDGEFDVVYQKPGDIQTVQLELDDPDSGISLDRTNYPRNTDVVATIDHQSLNVDPTSEDSWFLIVGEDPRYLSAGDADNIKTIAEAEAKRDAAINAAWERYNTAITNAESDRADLVKRADAARQGLVDAAEADRDELQATNQAILDNVLIPDEDQRRAPALDGCWNHN